MSYIIYDYEIYTSVKYYSNFGIKSMQNVRNGEIIQFYSPKFLPKYEMFEDLDHAVIQLRCYLSEKIGDMDNEMQSLISRVLYWEKQ